MWAVYVSGAMLAPPISAELWERLRRFDQQRCSISISRGEPYAHKFRTGGTTRTWQVHIRSQAPDVKVWESVHQEAGTLLEALAAAVEDGERRGWHRSPAPE